MSDSNLQKLCILSDVDDGQSAGFVVEHHDKRYGVMAVRQGGDLFVYLNSCPHIGSPLDFSPGQFLDLNREHIMCSTHGALFHIDTGQCISGPCAGKRLTPLSTKTENSTIYVDVTSLP